MSRMWPDAVRRVDPRPIAPAGDDHDVQVHDYVHDGHDPDPWAAAHACELPLDHGDAAPRARERRRELGIPSREEATRIAATFGRVLRTERGTLTQQELVDRARLDRKTIVRLEGGGQRPAAASRTAGTPDHRSVIRTSTARPNGGDLRDRRGR